MKSIEDTITEIISKYSTIPLTKDSYFEEGCINAMDTIMIFLETEMLLGIEIPDTDIEFKSVKDYISYVRNLIEK